jgi:nicotinamide riboside kinase
MPAQSETNMNSDGMPPTHLSGVYVVGPSSSGKTTLCKALAARLCLPRDRHISEVARSVMQASSFTREHVGMLAMQQSILNAQAEAESKARARYRGATWSPTAPFLLCDRSAIDPIVYAYFSTIDKSGAETLVESAELRGLLPVYRDALFVLLHPVVEWLEDDGVRSLDDPQKYPTVFKEYLEKFKLDYEEMGDSVKGLEDRVDMVLGWVADRKRS